MKISKHQLESTAYFAKRYETIFDRPLNSDGKFRLTDPGSEITRLCRFCLLSKPQVTFRQLAHAVPEFLGNNSLVSMNECDQCNHLFGSKYENDLAEWFGPLRTISQMKGKNGVPTYKDSASNGDVRIEMGDAGLVISIVDKDVEASLSTDGPFVLKLPAPTPTRPYIPISAAKAFVKIACSVCPQEYLDECQPAIDWLMKRSQIRCSKFPVLMAFTPGPNPYDKGRVLLLKRKVAEAIPSLWCVVETANYRFQFFVPLCPSDNWLVSGQAAQLTTMHYPVPFGSDWIYGETSYSVLDFTGTEKIVREVNFSMNVDRATEVPI